MQALNLQLDQLNSRLSKLADAYIDGVFDRDTYLQKKSDLLMELAAIKEKQDSLNQDQSKILERVKNFLELANGAYSSYKLANEEERRDFAKIVSSNFTVREKNVSIKLNYPFQIILERPSITSGSPQRGVPRTLSLY